MTDNEIIKALECCIIYKQICPETCPMVNVRKCKVDLRKSTLALINHQKEEKETLIAGQETLQKHIAKQNAEIEKLNAENKSLITANENLTTDLTSAKAEVERAYKTINEMAVGIKEIEKRLPLLKAEAVKEFAERLKRRFLNKNEVINNTIDNLVKEMLCESSSEQKPNWKESMMRTFLGGRSDG